MRKLGAVVCLLLLASACGDSSDSDELKALREKVSMLEEQITTTVAPATTTAGARFTDQERAFIDREVSALTSGSSSAALLPVSRSEARCFIEDIVEARGISGSEDLLERVEQQLSTGGRLSRSDTNAFLQPFVRCADLVLYTKADIVAEIPDVDADCLFQGLSEQQVTTWYEEYFINGEAAMNAALQAEIFPRIPDCLPRGGAVAATQVTTTTREPVTTTTRAPVTTTTRASVTTTTRAPVTTTTRAPVTTTTVNPLCPSLFVNGKLQNQIVMGEQDCRVELDLASSKFREQMVASGVFRYAELKDFNSFASHPFDPSAECWGEYGSCLLDFALNEIDVESCEPGILTKSESEVTVGGKICAKAKIANFVFMLDVACPMAEPLHEEIGREIDKLQERERSITGPFPPEGTEFDLTARREYWNNNLYLLVRITTNLCPSLLGRAYFIIDYLRLLDEVVESLVSNLEE